MICSDVLMRLDDYLDERLDPTEAEAVGSHLADCPSCGSEAEAVRRIRELSAKLPRSVDPPRDLWPEIAGRIEAAKIVRGRFRRRALVAAAAVAMLVGSVVTGYLAGRHRAPPPQDLRVFAGPGPSEVVLASFERLGLTDYQATRSQLLDALGERGDELSPETLEVVMTNLQLIDEAMGRIGEALGENPDNRLLMQQMAAAYRQQVNLLQRAVRLPAEV